MFWLIALGVMVGAFVPIQTAINSRLAGWLGAVLPASFVSFMVGTVGLAIAVLVTGTAVPVGQTASTQPWWIWLGGVCGLIFLTLNIVLLPRIGASATVILPLVGQVLGGVVIDLLGAFDTTPRALTLLRGLGAVLVVAGAIAVNVIGRRRMIVGEAHGRTHVLLWVIAIGGGVLGAVQTAVNGRLGLAMGSGLAAALVSFVIGTVGLAVVWLVSRQRVQRTGRPKGWMFSGGLLGAGFVLVNAINGPLLGTGLAVSVVQFGQVSAGLALDHTGWIGVVRRPVTVWRLVAAAVVLVGVLLVRFG
ncbi:MAG: DMT family transporter [Propionibacteriales bacterium]|nr:DMT family transporter [Propionibacteriales bacterium]